MRISVFNTAFLFLLTFTFSQSCKSKKESSSSNPDQPVVTVDYEKEGYVKATVIYFEIESCGFLLQLENQKKLEPGPLKEEFQKDQLPVWVKYVVKKDFVSTCQAGDMIDLTDIQLRK